MAVLYSSKEGNIFYSSQYSSTGGKKIVAVSYCHGLFQIISPIIYSRQCKVIGPLPDDPQTTVDKVASAFEFRLYLIDCL